MRTIIVIAALLLTGCVSMIDRPLAARVGMNIQQVIDQIGYPTTERVVAGRKVYTWTRRFAFQGDTMECELTYEVNDAGVVIDYNWHGQLGACNF